MNGPWEAIGHPSPHEGHWSIVPANNGWNGWKNGEYMDMSGICSESDARQMAAAPAMKGALDEVWLYLESIGHVMGLSELVEDALKQARGET